MGLSHASIGVQTRCFAYHYTWKDCVLYALSIGATVSQNIEYLYEGAGPRVCATFGLVPSLEPVIALMESVGIDPNGAIHGEHKLVTHMEIPPNGELGSVAEVTAVYDKGAAALVELTVRSYAQNGSCLATNVFRVFVRDGGGFGGPRGPKSAPAKQPDRAPDDTVCEGTHTEQAALYRLTGDLNGLHISQSVAEKAGFSKPILHGLCTLGFATRGLLGRVGHDLSQPLSVSARFTDFVYPGDQLTTQIWRMGNREFALQTKRGDGKTVLSGGVVQVTTTQEAP